MCIGFTRVVARLSLNWDGEGSIPLAAVSLCLLLFPEACLAVSNNNRKTAPCAAPLMMLLLSPDNMDDARGEHFGRVSRVG